MNAFESIGVFVVILSVISFVGSVSYFTYVGVSRTIAENKAGRRSLAVDGD